MKSKDMNSLESVIAQKKEKIPEEIVPENDKKAWKKAEEFLQNMKASNQRMY